MNDFYKFIGYIVVVLFIIYLFSKVMRLNARLIEGLTTMIAPNKNKNNDNDNNDNDNDDDVNNSL